jgi:hypothetical protein
VIVVLAVLSALVYGAGVAIQQRAALEEPQELAARPTLLVRLAQRPLWLAGLAADIAGFALQAAALHTGALVVVQPLITTNLLFALAIIAVWSRSGVSIREWAAVVVLLAGLCIFLIVGSPTEQSTARATAADWFVALGSGAAAVVTATLVGLRSSGRARAAAFAVAAGVADAYMAVLAKAFADSFDHGLVSVVTSWPAYALLVGGVSAILLTATAYQAGHATIALPIITIADPLFGSVVGVGLFGEALRLGGDRGPAVIGALVAMVVGLVVLTTTDRLTPVAQSA